LDKNHTEGVYMWHILPLSSS